MKDIYEWFINETNLLVKSLTLPLIFGILIKIGKFAFDKIRTYKAGRNLFPYYTNKIIEAAQKRYIRTKCQNIDPSNEINLKQSFAFATKEDLLKFFLKKVFRIKENENRFYLVLADSGMGKTTFFINLFIRYKSIFYLNIHKKKSQRTTTRGGGLKA